MTESELNALIQKYKSIDGVITVLTPIRDALVTHLNRNGPNEKLQSEAIRVTEALKKLKKLRDSR